MVLRPGRHVRTLAREDTVSTNMVMASLGEDPIPQRTLLARPRRSPSDPERSVRQRGLTKVMPAPTGRSIPVVWLVALPGGKSMQRLTQIVTGGRHNVRVP
jgi:hypothetical protein